MENSLLLICHLDCQPIERKGCVSCFFDLPKYLIHKKYS